MAPTIRPLRFRSGGNLREGDFYVERASDGELYEALLQGEYCHVLAPRQIGKSSLRIRTERRLRDCGIRCAAIDLTAISDGVGGGGTPEQWYATLVDKVAERLKLAEEAAKAGWQRSQGTLTHRWIRFLHEQVLSADSTPVVIFLDEIDFIQRAPFCSDFFASIRALYNLRAEEAVYQRLTFCLVGVAAPADLIEDAALTPFNIGQGIRLQDFSLAEAAALLPGLAGALGDPQQLLAAVHSWSNGHPYMTQRLCETLVARRSKAGAAPALGPADGLAEPARVAQVVKEIFLQRREEDLNLTAAEKRLEQSPRRSQLLRLYRRLLDGEPVGAHKDDPVQLELRLTGMAAECGDPQGDRWLQVRNRIFATVFDRQWVESKEPNPLLTQVLPLWLKSGQREEYLLRGQLLKEAQAWAQGRPDLSPDERNFLIAGLEVDKREEKNAELQLQRHRAAAERDRTRRKSIAVLFAMIVLLLIALGGSLKEYQRLQQAKKETSAQLVRAIAAETEARKQRQTAEREKDNANAQGHKAENERQKAEQEKAAADQARTAAEQSLTREASAKQQAEAAKEAALLSEGKARQAEGTARQRQQEAEAAEKAAETALSAAEQSAQAEKAARALVLTQQPGREFEALVTAMEAAGPNLQGRSHLSMQELARDGSQGSLGKVVEGLIAAVTAMRYAVPPSLVLRGGHDRVLWAAFSPDGQRVITVYQDDVATLWDARTGQKLGAELSPVMAADFSPDSSLVATIGRGSGLQLWHSGDATLVKSADCGPADRLGAVAFSSDGHQVLAADANLVVCRWDLRTGQVQKDSAAQGSAPPTSPAHPQSDPVRKFLAAHPDLLLRQLVGGPSRQSSAGGYSPAGRVLMIVDDGIVRLFNAQRREINNLGDNSERAVFSPSGHLVATTNRLTWTVEVWNAQTAELVRSLDGHQSSVLSVRFSADERRLLTAGKDGTARLWMVDGSQPTVVLRGHARAVNIAVFSPGAGADGDRQEGRQVLTASDDGTARLWQLTPGPGRPTDTAPPLMGPLTLSHHSAVNGAVFSPDGLRLLTIGWDNRGILWDRTGAQLAVLGGHKDIISAAQFSRDGTRVLTASRDGTALLWPLPLGGPASAAGSAVALAPVALLGHRDTVSNAAFSMDGRQVVTASQDGAVRLFDAASGQLVRMFQPDRPPASHCLGALAAPPKRGLAGHAAAVTSVAFSADGRWILSGAKDCTAQLWEVATGKAHGLPMELSGGVNSVAFSTDSRLWAAADQAGTVRLGNLPDALRAGPLASSLALPSAGPDRLGGPAHSAAVNGIVFSHDSKLLLSASSDGTAKLWEVATHREQTLKGHAGEVFAAEFSQDDQLIATASQDGTARLWDTLGSKSLATLRGARGSVYAADFAPDGRTLATASLDQTARLYSTDVIDYLQLGCQLLRYQPEYARVQPYCR